MKTLLFLCSARTHAPEHTRPGPTPALPEGL